MTSWDTLGMADQHSQGPPSGAPSPAPSGPGGSVVAMAREDEPGPSGAASVTAGGRPGAAVRTTPWWVGVAIAGTAFPVVVAVARALRQGWLPMGDNAYFTVRSRDVLGPHHPLLGAWSSGSRALGGSVNNLGPLQLDLLAPFTKVGWAAGTAVGAGALAVASIVGIGLVARRLLPPVGVLLTLLATAVVAWTMGSQLFLETRQHHALILPFLLYLVLVWGLAAGDRWLLPWAVAVGTLLVQTHLSYLVLASLLGGWGLVALVVRTRRVGLVAPALTSLGVAALLWAQPLVDQVTGRGNLTDLLRSGSGDEGSAPGPAGAVRIVGRLLAWPPRWLRAGFVDFAPAGSDGTVRAVAGLVVVVAVLGLAGWRSRARGDATATAAVATAAVAVGAGLAGAAVTPAGSLGPVVGNYRWLWPLALFVVLAAVIGVGGAGAVVPSRAGGRRLGGVVVGVALVVVTLADLPAHHGLEVTRVDRRLRPVAAEVVRQLEDAEVRGPVLFDRSRAAFGEPYSYVVLAALQSDGVAFTFDEADPAAGLDVLRFGEGRADEGRAEQRLVLVTGPAAHDLPPGARRVALAAVPDAGDDPIATAALYLEPVG